MKRNYYNPSMNRRRLQEGSFGDEDEMYQDEYGQEMGNFGEEMDMEEPIDDKNFDENEDLSEEPVMKIRRFALEGVQKYEDDVDSVQYEFYKKIWDMCDKIMSRKEKDNANNGK